MPSSVSAQTKEKSKVGSARRLSSPLSRVLTAAGVCVRLCAPLSSEALPWLSALAIAEQISTPRDMSNSCRLSPISPLTPAISIEQQVTQNASQLICTLSRRTPHHRAPLLHHLSKGLPSTTAAKLFGTSASYVRQVKRKDHSDADLMQDR